MKTEHTPLPWGYDLNHTIGHHENGEWLESVVQLPVGTHKRRPTAQEKADCLFIVRACNNHDALVAALSVITLDDRIVGWLSNNDPKALEQARSALKKLNT